MTNFFRKNYSYKFCTVLTMYFRIHFAISFTRDRSSFAIPHNTSYCVKWRTCAPYDRQVVAAVWFSFDSSGQPRNFPISICDTNDRNSIHVCRRYWAKFLQSLFRHFSVSETNRSMQVQKSRLVIGRHTVLPFVFYLTMLLPIPVAARSKTWVYGRSLTGIVG
jgi:hypothetical protein